MPMTAMPAKNEINAGSPPDENLAEAKENIADQQVK
jgi:hypothetical protein